ncbi:MAG TPA: TetR/AcrR family transcriptional regulator [Parvularculaceae bacterium]|nr:TetR/AcrR family transcriptional regulator [Parvularculaceae bacterium]
MASPMRKPRWRRRAEARPDEILAAALAEFTESGFEATRVEDVARRAGLSKAGVYLYFDSKDALLRALIEHEVEPVAERVAALAEAGKNEPLEALRTIVGAFVALTADPALFAVPRIILSVAGRFPEIGAFYRAHVVERGLGAIAMLHRSGVEKGVFRDVDSRLAARAIVGPLMLNALWRHVLGGAAEMAPEAAAEAHFDLVLKGLLR